MRHFVSAALLMTLLSAPVFAQEKQAPKAEVKKEAPAKEKAKEASKTESVVKVPKEDAAKNTPIQKWIDAENALIDPLSDKDKESFFILRSKHSYIRVINVVKRDIGAAVASCGEKNPDIKGKMDTRFTEWKNAVEPIIETAQKTLDKDIANQKIVDVAKAKNVLKLNDEAFEYGEKQITKKPVTSKEACEDLVESMDDTEDRMITLLQETLLPESVIKKRAEADEKTEKAATKKAE